VADWTDIVSWLIIFAGWIVVNRQNNSRETRKEVRASLLDLYEHLDQIEVDAFAYHTGTGDVLLAHKLKRDIDQVVPRIKLALRGPMTTCRYGKQLIAFRQSITLQNFDSATFAPKKPSDTFFEVIVVSKRALIYCLELADNNSYT
jgi:hypothetical protein